MIEWKELKLKDFLSWDRLALNLTPGHPTLVLGDNRDNAGASSNGSGKSAIFDGLVWTLFGNTLRGLSGDDVIRSDTEEARGSVSWRQDGKTYEVERSRKPGETSLMLSIKGTSIGGLTPTITQKRIESALGFTCDTFIAACIFGQDVTRWATYTDKDQKLILERLIGLEQWDKILKQVRDSKTAQSLSRQLAEASYAQAERDLKDLAHSRAEIDTEEEAWKSTIDAKVEETTKELEKVSLASRSAKADLADKTLLKDELSGRSKDLQDAQNLRQTALLEKAKLEGRKERLGERLIKLDEEQAELEIQTEDDTCPTCEKVLGEDGAAVVNRGSKTKIAAIEEDRKKTEDAIAETEAGLSKELPPEPDQDLLARLAQANEDVAACVTEIHRCESRQASLLSEVASLTSKAESFEAARTVLEGQEVKAKDKLEQFGNEVNEAHKNKLSYDYLEKAFGPQGIRSFLLESILPRFEGWANEVLKELGPNLRLQLRSQSALKSGELREKLSCEVFLDGREARYDSLSAGERQRVDVAIALGLESLASERTPVGLAVFDEIFERLDPEGCERVARLLRKRFARTGCWVITHNDALKSMFSTVLLVRKENGVSALK
jgi:DNA repair exonuclease SbcCD ATPase subunit